MSDPAFTALTEWRIKMENNYNETSKDIAVVKQSLDDLKETVGNSCLSQKEGIAEIKEMIKKMDEEKADVWVEKAVSKITWIVMIAVIGAILTLVVKSV